MALPLILLVQCGIQPGGTSGDDVVVEISPSLLTLKPGQTAQIRARQTYVEKDARGEKVVVADSNPEAFYWELEGDSDGASLLLDRGARCVVFQSPRRVGTVRVVARSRRDDQAFGRMTVTIEE